MRKPILIIVTGPSASGKTTFAKSIINRLKNVSGMILSMDNYYRDFPHLSLEERRKINFDEPKAIDWKLLKKNLNELLKGKKIKKPIYSFKKDGRIGFENVEPADLIILEGIMALWSPHIRKLAKRKIYLNTPLDECFIRRLSRDVKERGYNTKYVINYWRNIVRPGYYKYVEPTKKYADEVIAWMNGTDHQVAKELKLIKKYFNKR